MSSPVRYGLDAEVHQKIKSKFDPGREAKAIEWIEQISGEKVGDFFNGLKNGVILCKLMNRIRPGIVFKFTPNPTHPLVERENIQAYLNACVALGVPSQDLFTISDLHEGKFLPQVLQNIFAVGRQAQVISNFDGPTLGVRYTTSTQDLAKRKESKEKQAQKEYENWKEKEEGSRIRRLELETQKKDEALKKKSEEAERAEQRRLTRTKSELGDSQKTPIKDSDKLRPTAQETQSISISPVRYGMDLEHQQKIKAKYDVAAEEKAMDWIEAVTGERIDVFHKGLKSGVVLCKLINKIRPGMITKINTKPVALMERENLQMYLNACASLGVPPFELFVVSDLYEKKDLGAVVANIHAVARVAQHIPSFKGPQLGVKLEEIKRAPEPPSPSSPVKVPSGRATAAHPARVPSGRATTGQESTDHLLPKDENKRCCSSCNIM